MSKKKQVTIQEVIDARKKNIETFAEMIAGKMNADSLSQDGPVIAAHNMINQAVEEAKFIKQLERSLEHAEYCNG